MESRKVAEATITVTVHIYEHTLDDGTKVYDYYDAYQNFDTIEEAVETAANEYEGKATYRLL